MTRSGYVEDDEENTMGLWRANVDRAIRGKRGQSFLREMLVALDAMPVKRLIAHDLVNDEGCVCAMGAVALRRGVDVSTVDESEPEEVARAMGLSRVMVQEIAYENDERGWRHAERRNETDEERWARMREWVAAQILDAPEGKR